MTKEYESQPVRLKVDCKTGTEAAKDCLGYYNQLFNQMLIEKQLSILENILCTL